MRWAAAVILLASIASAQTTTPAPAQIQRAVIRALPLLEHSASLFVAKRTCVSCHHNILPILMLHQARDRGLAIDETVLRAVEEKTFRQLRSPAALDTAVQAATLNDPTPDDSYLLMAAYAAGMPRDLTLEVYAQRLVGWQRDGHWVTSDFRPPQSSSVFTATATAIRAIQLYLPGERRTQDRAAVERARRWLDATPPASIEDASFRVLGLVWAEASAEEVGAAAKDLVALAKPGGGWPQLPGYPADAYSTGEALYALHQAGVPTSTRVWRKGLGFLLTTQAADGTWRVQTRMVSPADVSPQYFFSGFPYQKDEYLSYAGSCWAVMALLSALPEPPHRERPQADRAGDAWIRTALFGTASQLSGALDAGLDPNLKTAGGTTLLMMAAPEAEKVRLLLSRGADAKARAVSGCDALTVAAATRGTAKSLEALLAAGAQPQAPAGVHARNNALLFASMTGDLDNIKLLLGRGAQASAAALSAALTFGYPDVAGALIAAGAPVQGTEASGINLLHWAAITDRPAVIPLLVGAGVPLNAVDENGYTPLMYAATIDFGDIAVLEALLKAGADRTVRNAEGLTAVEQARHFHHARLAAVLK